MGTGLRLRERTFAEQPAPALKALDRAIELSPCSVAAYQLRARVAKERGDWQSELRDIDRMLMLEPSNQWAKTYKPDVLLRLAPDTSPVRGDETYAVYSAVLAHPVWDHADADSLLLIAEQTGATYGGMDPANCVKPPPEYQKMLDEAPAEYKARKSNKARFQARFHILRPYRLLNDEECSGFTDFRFRGKEPSAELGAIFRQTPDRIRLSQFFFSQVFCSKDQMLALVLVSNYCGGLCGGEKWRVLIKRSGAWVDEDWIRCFTVS